MPLIYNIDRVGFRIDLCGTWHLIDRRTEGYSLIFKYSVLLDP